MEDMKGKGLKGLILKAIGLAMGIAVLVLSILGSLDMDNAIRLLSLGLVAFGLYLFQDKK